MRDARSNQEQHTRKHLHLVRGRKRMRGLNHAVTSR